MARLRGTVFPRPNGTFTAQTEPIWDPKAGRKRRLSLGTYGTIEEAQEARLTYNSGGVGGMFSLPEVEQRQNRLDAYLGEWLELVERERLNREISLRTQRDYETIVQLHIVPYLGRRRIGDLSPALLHSWHLDLRAGGVGQRTVQKAQRTLHRALADSALKENPAKLPKRYRPKVSDHRQATYPTGKQIAVFMEHVEHCESNYGRRLKVLWRIAATAGLRRAELVGLTWDDVDLSAGTISINHTLNIDRGSLYVKGPKSDRGYRTIRLDAATVRDLRRHRVTMLRQRAAAGESYATEPLGYDFVFRADAHGSPLKPERLTPAFVSEWAHTGFPPGPTLHGLRHTNGSLLLLSGLAPIHVAAHLGHDLQTLNKVYAHELDPVNRQEVIAEAVGAIYR